MDWQERLRREALRARFHDFDLLYHVSLKPAVPREYEVEGLVGLTFRVRPREGGGFVYATVLDVPAALRFGARIGLEPAEAIALVDSHERVHVAMQLAGVDEATEEEQSHLVDAVMLSFRHPRLAEHLQAGDFGLVTRVGPGYFEALLDLAAHGP